MGRFNFESRLPQYLIKARLVGDIAVHVVLDIFHACYLFCFQILKVHKEKAKCYFRSETLAGQNKKLDKYFDTLITFQYVSRNDHEMR